ncbi:MAG: hypothetical protein HQL17_06340 [Candidatus Omnitrophica bacterium]|nr:hypothetical protein [Candidatus Omnitrophota bacterium]
MLLHHDKDTALKLKKLFAVEWVMFWLFGLFWAAAMFLPLFLTGSFENKQQIPQSLLIMFGLYLMYLVVRCVHWLGQSLFKAYLHSNLFFKSEFEKVAADEWFRFVVLAIFWSMIMAFPMYAAGFFVDRFAWPVALAILLGPYAGYLCLRLGLFLIQSFFWAFGEGLKK